MNGVQFAELIKLIGDSKYHGIYTYTDELIKKLEKDFIALHAENSHFTVSNLLDLLVSFDRVCSLGSMKRLVPTIIEKLPDSVKNSDRDMLKLFKIFDRLGILQMAQHEHLVEFILEHVATRFDFIDKKDVLEFAEFFREVGLWQWEQHLITQIEAHFSANFVSYDVKAMCKLMKLIGGNYIKSDTFLSLIEDSLRLRLQHFAKHSVSTESQINVETVRDFTEGLNLLG